MDLRLWGTRLSFRHTMGGGQRCLRQHQRFDIGSLNPRRGNMAWDQTTEDDWIKIVVEFRGPIVASLLLYNKPNLTYGGYIR